MVSGNLGNSSGQYTNLGSFGGSSYRNYLQNIANSGSGLLAQEASALLQVVGDDGRINDQFVSDPYGYTGTDRGQVFSTTGASGENVGYGPQGLSRINDIYSRGFTGAANERTGSTGTGGSGGGADPNQIGLYDQAISSVQNNIGRLPGQLKTAFSNIADQYGVGINQLDSSRQQAESDYQGQTTQNSQNYRTDKNIIADQASQGLRGLLRTLGAFGAGGSSDARFVAPQAVSQQASIQRSGAGQNFSQNQSNVDGNWSRFQSQDENERKKLADWQTQQRQQAETQSQTTRQSLLQKLAELTGAKASYTGGNYAQAAQPYIEQAQALNPQIDALARFKPTYSGNTPVYEAAPLDSYNASGTGAQVGQNALESTNSPYLAMLLGQQDERRRV